MLKRIFSALTLTTVLMTTILSAFSSLSVSAETTQTAPEDTGLYNIRDAIVAATSHISDDGSEGTPIYTGPFSTINMYFGTATQLARKGSLNGINGIHTYSYYSPTPAFGYQRGSFAVSTEGSSAITAIMGASEQSAKQTIQFVAPKSGWYKIIPKAISDEIPQSLKNCNLSNRTITTQFRIKKDFTNEVYFLSDELGLNQTQDIPSDIVVPMEAGETLFFEFFALGSQWNSDIRLKANFDVQFVNYNVRDAILMATNHIPNDGTEGTPDYTGIPFSTTNKYYESAKQLAKKVTLSGQAGVHTYAYYTPNPSQGYQRGTFDVYETGSTAITATMGTVESGAKQTITFTAPESGMYRIVPKAISDTVSASLKNGNLSGRTIKTQLRIKSGDMVLFLSNELGLNETQNIPDDLIASLETGDTLTFEFFALGSQWNGDIRLTANFEIVYSHYNVRDALIMATRNIADDGTEGTPDYTGLPFSITNKYFESATQLARKGSLNGLTGIHTYAYYTPNPAQGYQRGTFSVSETGSTAITAIMGTTESGAKQTITFTAQESGMYRIVPKAISDTVSASLKNNNRDGRTIKTQLRIKTGDTVLFLSDELGLNETQNMPENMVAILNPGDTLTFEFFALGSQWNGDIRLTANFEIVYDPYTIDKVPFGGGGYVTGIVMHPRNEKIRYIRTDVGGAYKWDAYNNEWIPITDSFRYDQTGLYGIDGIAIDPNNENVVYIACGDGNPAGTRGVYKSTDYGETWTLIKAQFYLGNASLREVGECIYVDPNNSNIIYAGARSGGLFRTADGGATWTHIATIPGGETNIGVRAVIVDPRETVNGASSRVYASLPNVGLYESIDGGLTFSKVESAPATVRNIDVASDGTVYMTSTVGVYAYSSGQVANISPNDTKVVYNALDVDPTNPDRIIVCHANTGSNDCMNMTIYYTENRGETWTTKNNGTKHDMPGWWRSYQFSSATSDIMFNPFNLNEVWFTDWYGTWFARNITASSMDWHLRVNGHEETVIFEVATLPEGPTTLLVGMADVDGACYQDINLSPVKLNGFTTNSFDYSPAAPGFVAACGSPGNGSSGVVAISTDYGKTFTSISGWDSTKISMQVAVSATNKDNMVVMSLNNVPMYTLDGGATWLESTGVPTDVLTSFWSSPKSLVSDKVNGGVFYIASKYGIYKSTNSGASFTLVNSEMSTGQNGFKIKTTGAASELVLVKSGLVYFSADGGTTWTQNTAITNCRDVSYGLGRYGTGNPSMYVLGCVDGEFGLYISDDMGQTFRKINDDSNNLGKASSIAADQMLYGRVFIGTSGRGIMVAQ